MARESLYSVPTMRYPTAVASVAQRAARVALFLTIGSLLLTSQACSSRPAADMSASEKKAIADHVAVLADIIVLWAARLPDVELVTPSVPKQRAGIVALRMRNAAAVSEALTAANVSHSLREGSIRLSPHFYNTREEIRCALAVIEDALSC